VSVTAAFYAFFAFSALRKSVSYGIMEGRKGPRAGFTW